MMGFDKNQIDMVKQLGLKDTKKVIELVGKQWGMYCDDCKVRSPYVLPCDDCVIKTAPIMKEIKAIQDKHNYKKK